MPALLKSTFALVGAGLAPPVCRPTTEALAKPLDPASALLHCSALTREGMTSVMSPRFLSLGGRGFSHDKPLEERNSPLQRKNQTRRQDAGATGASRASASSG